MRRCWDNTLQSLACDWLTEQDHRITGKDREQNFVAFFPPRCIHHGDTTQGFRGLISTLGWAVWTFCI